jgi:hypothetical protein
MTFDGTSVTLAGRLINSYTSLASAPAKHFTGSWFTGGTSTTTKPHFLIEPAGTTSTAWSASGTGLGVNAPSGFAGNLLDLQMNGVTTVYATAAGLLGATTANIGSTIISSTGVTLVNTRNITFTGSLVGTVNWGDLFIARDAANTLAQRNDANAQTSRIYNTFTSATNFERAKIEWASNILRIGTEKGSAGGTARDMELQTDGTTRITVKANGAILFSGIPTSNPNVAGQLWNDGGTLKISAG